LKKIFKQANVLVKLATIYIIGNKPKYWSVFKDLPELRELIIAFGDSGYVSLYRHDRVSEMIYILAFRQ